MNNVIYEGTLTTNCCSLDTKQFFNLATNGATFTKLTAQRGNIANGPGTGVALLKKRYKLPLSLGCDCGFMLAGELNEHLVNNNVNGFRI